MAAEPGNPAPDFDLPSVRGGHVHLSDLWKKHAVVLYFYPRDGLASSATEACEFSEKHREFKALDSVVVGVSPDDPKHHEKFMEKHHLHHLLLSDMSHRVAVAYGVWKEGAILRSTFVIGRDGVVKKAWRDVGARGHAAQVLAALADLGGPAPAPAAAAAADPPAPAASATPPA